MVSVANEVKTAAFTSSMFYLIKKFAALDLGLPEQASLNKKAGNLLAKCTHTLNTTLQKIASKQNNLSTLVTKIAQNSETEGSASHFNQLLTPLQDSINTLNTEKETLKKDVEALITKLHALKEKPEQIGLQSESINNELTKIEKRIEKFDINASALEIKQENSRKETQTALLAAGISPDAPQPD